jgi:hypothetical protein
MGGRPAYQRKDPTMRFIAKKHLWDAIAKQCGITPSAVRLWRRVPIERVCDVESAIGRPRELIRPDIYRRKRPTNQQQARSA